MFETETPVLVEVSLGVVKILKFVCYSLGHLTKTYIYMEYTILIIVCTAVLT